MAENDQPQPKPEDWEFDVAFEGPASAVNRWFINAENGYVRIGFCEQRAADSPLRFRTAIVLSEQDAAYFGEMVQSFMQRRNPPAVTTTAPTPTFSAGLLGEILNPKKPGV